MNIRKAEENDLRGVVDIFITEFLKEPFKEIWSKENALKKVKKYFKESNILVAEINNEIVGFIISSTYLFYDGNRGYIEDICVKEEFKKKGIGTKLMQKAEDYFKEKGIKTFNLMTSKKNDVFKFYEKLGYKETHLVLFEKNI